MNHGVYSIHDKKTGEYSQPFFARNDQQAVRNFTGACTNEEQTNMLARYPRDFTLCKIGEWDDDAGMINGSIPQPMLTADSAIMRYKQDRAIPEGNLNG